MAAVTICNDFGAQKNSLTLFILFPQLFPMKWWERMPWSSFSECWALSQLFHSPLSPSSEKPKWEKTYIHTHFSIGRAFKFNSYFSKFNLNNVENFFPSYYIKTLKFSLTVSNCNIVFTVALLKIWEKIPWRLTKLQSFSKAKKKKKNPNSRLS